ncbi:uncharacterized protein LOC125230212 [Leguminivora glycinivorella]|uniref:uncharacterized protein LOC125230212 n=2 Tax=Leguminivora glycinivorella TaxID=1035111 RepID=UPI00200E5248|nr:uncharacterized protein LOC125230212 [Leguminivora glycinivorella]
MHSKCVAPWWVGNQFAEIFHCLFMDTKVPVTTGGGDAVPVRDEAKAHSAKVAAPAISGAVCDRSTSVGSGNTWTSARTGAKRRGHGGAGHPNSTNPSLPLGLKSGGAKQAPLGEPTSAGAGGMGRGATANCGRDVPLPNSGGAAPGAIDDATAPQGVDAQSGGGVAPTRRQKRRAKARANRDAQEGAGPSTSGAGRQATKRSLGASGDSSLLAGDHKRTRVGGTFAEVAASEKMAIVPVTFPEEKVLLEHRSAIVSVLLVALDEAADPMPDITLGAVTGGALHITCGGSDAVGWLRSVIGRGEIGGRRLKVVAAKDLPKPVKMAWRTAIDGSQDVALALRVMQRRNPKLRTDEWKVVDTVMSELNTRRIVLMDQVSADVIREAGYVLHSGLDTSHFKLLETGKEREHEEAGVEPGTDGGEGDSAADKAAGAAGAATGEAPERDAPPGAPAEVAGDRSEAGEVVLVGESLAGLRWARESSPISSMAGSEDLRGLEELYLEGTTSPMSCDNTVQEVAADLSTTKH